MCVYVYMPMHLLTNYFSYLLKYKCTKTQIQSIYSLIVMNIHDMLTHSLKNRNMITYIYSQNHLHINMNMFIYTHSVPAHKLTSTLINTVTYMHMNNIHTYIHALT